jgi:hypothetical protein
MALKSNFNEMKSMMNVRLQADGLYKRIIQSYKRAGLKFIVNARNQGQIHAQGQYEDQTTNLRNSIGFYIFRDGILVEEFIHEKSTETSYMTAVEPFIKTSGIQLIGFAGMNYASYVEAKGYNVISYQADLCMIDLSYYLERLEVIEEGRTAEIEDLIIPE